MEYQKTINLLDRPNQPFKFQTKNWVKINDESRWTLTLTKIIKLDLKLQCFDHVCVIKVMSHIYLLKEL